MRDAVTWTPGGNTQGAILAVVEPISQTLEDLWEGRTEIEVYGPTGAIARLRN